MELCMLRCAYYAFVHIHVQMHLKLCMLRLVYVTQYHVHAIFTRTHSPRIGADGPALHGLDCEIPN